MAADAQPGYPEHWTAEGGVMGAALLAGVFVPFAGLAVVVPCLLAARRAGVKTTPYVIALVVALLWIVLLALSFATQLLIEPGPA
jgi:hypothetical protein